MYHSNFIVLFKQILPRLWTQMWTQTFIVAYPNPTFKSVKSNSFFRNWYWDAVKSAQALTKGCIQSTNQYAICLARIYQFLIWTGSNTNLFFICMLTNPWMCCTNELDQHQSKPVVYMGLSQVKILETCCFILTNQNASFRQAKRFIIFFFASLNLDTSFLVCCTFLVGKLS